MSCLDHLLLLQLQGMPGPIRVALRQASPRPLSPCCCGEPAAATAIAYDPAVRHTVTLIVNGLEPGPETEQSLRELGVALLGLRGPNAWLLGEVEAGFFSMDDKRARLLAAQVEEAFPDAQAVAFMDNDQHGRTMGFLLGDRYSPPPGLGQGRSALFASGDEVRWDSQIERRELDLEKELRQARKEAKKSGLDPNALSFASLPSAFDAIEGNTREQLIGMRTPAPELSSLSAAAPAADQSPSPELDAEL